MASAQIHQGGTHAYERVRPAELSLLAETARLELNRVAKAAPAAVTMLVSSQRDLGLAVASTLARFWVPDPAVREHDVMVAIPDGRWSIEQLRELVLEKLFTVPLMRRVVVIDRVDEIDDSTADSLLKAIEEPGKDTVFILVAADEAELKATIRGRVVQTIILQPASPQDRAKLLVDAGADVHVATESVRLAGKVVVLAPALAERPELLEVAASLQSTVELSATMPVTAAVAAVESIDKLASVLGERLGGGDRAARAAKRSLVESHVEQVRNAAVVALRTGSDQKNVEAVLNECDRALERLGTHAPHAVNLSALHLRHAKL